MSATTDIAFVDLRRQYATIKQDVDDAIQRVVDATDFILGDAVDRFETRFADHHDVAHCVGVNSGTAALHLALEAMGVGPGDEVIAPANTFIATVLPVLKLGARPVLVDCDRDTATIDPEAVAAAITERTRAVIAVHLYGQPADMAALAAICESRGVAILEDACQAHGARHDGRRVGSLGNIAAWSFYPGKNLGAYGDGGAITTDDEAIAARLRTMRHLGQRKKYEHVLEGWNERLDTIQAAVLGVKLSHLDAWNARRREIAERYTAGLNASGIETPKIAPWAEHVWHLYVVRTERRDELQQHLSSLGVATGLHYPTPLHLQPALRALGYEAGDFPRSEEWSRTLLSLPMYAELEDEEVDFVVGVICDWAASAGLEPQ